MRLIATIAAAVCAVAVNAASLVWLPGFGDAAKGAYRGARNAVEEVGEAAAKNMDNVGRAIPEIGRVQTDFIDGATVTSFGKTIGTGTVDVQSTIKGIENGTVLPRTEFNNKEGLLPSAGKGYYKEFVLPTPGANGVGSQRIIRGDGGEYYYTPDHYHTFIPLN